MKILPTEFDGKAIRRVYEEDTETWWFSVIDVVQVLTDSNNARRYWSDLKRKLAQEAGSEQPYEKIVQLKMTSPDGKKRETDCATAETLLRLVQSVPSPKAEPIKLWLAKVGYERMQEMADPALSLDRARQTWQQHGRSDKWIQQRMTGQETRNKLTDYWSEHDIKAGQRVRDPHQHHSPGVVGRERQRAQGYEGPCQPQPARPHERGGADFYRAGRVVHPPDCRECGGHRHGRKQNRCESGRAHCRPSPQPT
jgi:prophage antirepressor-like protein